MLIFIDKKSKKNSEVELTRRVGFQFTGFSQIYISPA